MSHIANQVSSGASIERVLACPNIPTLPVVAMRILELTSKQDVSLREIAAVIENDPAIATKVLRTVNSSYYALSRRCASIQQALAFLGLQTVKGLVLGFSLARSINGGGDDEVSFDFLEYWRRSLYSAAAAREIAILSRRCDPDEAFVASLVQDIGMVALWRAYGDRYLQVIDLAKGDHRRLAALELRSIEIDHTIVSSEMLSRWRFPESTVSAVRFQHRSHEAGPDALMLARTVELAGTAATVLSMKDPHAELARFRRDGQDWFEIRPAPLTLLLQKIADQADELSRAFGLEIGSSADIDAIMKSAATIRREQNLAVPDLDSCDLVDHGSITIDSIPDARSFGRDLEQAFLTASPRAGIGLLLVGIDRARQVQETFGIRGVEAAMNQVLDVVRSIGGGERAVYRFVGAEIAVVLPHTDIEELCRIAELVRRKFAETGVAHPTTFGASFPATVTVGASLYESDEVLRRENSIASPDQLVSAAMFALANGRRTRNRVVVFHRELTSEQQESVSNPHSS